jgi:hypothetical protein
VIEQIGPVARWISFLSRPVLHGAGLLVSIKYRDVSRQMIWITSGFGLLLAHWLFPMLCSFSEVGRRLYKSLYWWPSLAYPMGWAMVVVGLALVLREFEIKQSREELYAGP